MCPGSGCLKHFTQVISATVHDLKANNRRSARKTKGGMPSEDLYLAIAFQHNNRKSKHEKIGL